MFKKILVPIDFSERNRQAIQVAVKLAKQNRGRVILMHVIENIESISDEEMEDFYDKLEQNAETKFLSLSRIFIRTRIPLERVIARGRRANEIVKYAIATRCDLIIMGSHRVSTEEGWSTLSYRTALLAPCPVLLVK
jgi:nucleotide-binding universal stress UspA family protein